MALKQTLADWCLGHTEPAFQAAGISFSDFPTLKYEDLKNVLSNVHDFVIFFEKLDEWRKTNLETDGVLQPNRSVPNWGVDTLSSFELGNYSLTTDSIINPETFDCTLPELRESMYTALVPAAGLITENENPETLKAEPLSQNNFRESRALAVQDLQVFQQQGKQVAPDVPIAALCTRSSLSIAAKNDKNGNPPALIRSISNTTPKLDLQTFLNKDSDGKSILTIYRKTGYLTSRLRNVLVQMIIKKKKDEVFENVPVDTILPEFRITKNEFMSWASEIHAVFPTESTATYYIPYAKVRGQPRICASGKLWEHFHYTKTVLHKSGLLSSRRDNKDSTPETNGDDELIGEINDDDREKISWLKTYIEPWNRVVEYWSKTFQIRRQDLTNENTSVSEYMKTYRCLQQELGAELLKHDFEKLYPGKGEALINKWEAIRTRLVELLLGPRKPKGLDNELLLNKLKTSTPESQDGLVLYLLPTLVKATQIKYQPAQKKRKIADNSDGRKKRSNQKPSILESQEAFVLRVQNAASVEPAIATKKAQLLQLGLSTQPHIVLVGPVDGIQASYVIVDNVRYTTTSPLRALDLAFKIFYATDCAYPSQAFHIWLFIQKVAYDITNSGDKFGTNINTLIGEVLSS